MKNKNQDIIISLKDVSKSYHIANNSNFSALNNINLTIHRGDKIGIVGNNGAGKTTLLKIISGVAQPTQGSVSVTAKIASLIDLEAGFEPELTGYENIMVNGLILGMKKQEIELKMKTIIDFAGVGSFIYEPFYTYSSGMKFRLACAVAVNSSAEVLLFDEILSSSDWEFQRKIFKLIVKTFTNKNITTIFCSYVPETLWSLSNSYYLMQKGEIKPINKAQFRKLAIAHIKDFHTTFETRDIERVAVDLNK